MTTEILKQLAFMQYNGEDFFICDDIAYIGNEQEANEAFNESDDLTFEEWVNLNYEQVEAFDNDNYLVLDDGEADEAWDEYLDNYIEECILHELPEQYRNYFDNDRWKEDARQDGRGHCLSGYNGNEYKETVNDEDGDLHTFYIYRQN